MSFSTTYAANEILVLSENDQIVWGTCMLGETYGTIKDCEVGREWDTEEIENCVGGLLAFIWKKPRFTMTINTRFDLDVTAPGAGDQILFPIPAVYGRVIKPAISWEQGGVRGLSIEATFWDELANAPLNKWTGSTNVQIDDGTDPA